DSATMSVQDVKSASMAKQIQKQQTRMKTKTVPHKAIHFSTAKTLQPKAWVDLPNIKLSKKQKKKKPVDVLNKAFRQRSWKVPTMKQIIGIRM
ncbi:unnamed protein product, partial [marine sediment metagenome]